MGEPIRSGDVVVFAGDSITDADRIFGKGACSHGVLGEGYVRDTVELLLARDPGLSVMWHNSGVAGLTSRGLLDLWADHVLRHNPDLVTLLVGTNDCNFRLIEHEAGVSVEEYAANLDALVSRTLDSGARMVLLEPFYLRVSDTTDDEGRFVLKHLADYRAAMRALAEAQGIPFIPLHDLFQQQLAQRGADDLCPEPVHPNRWGHLLIAHHLAAHLAGELTGYLC